MVTLDRHYSSWNGIPFYIVVYGFYVYHFSVSKIFLKSQCPIYLKLGYIIYNSAKYFRNTEIIYINPTYNYVKWDPILHNCIWVLCISLQFF